MMQIFKKNVSVPLIHTKQTCGFLLEKQFLERKEYKKEN